MTRKMWKIAGLVASGSVMFQLAGCAAAVGQAVFENVFFTVLSSVISGLFDSVETTT